MRVLVCIKRVPAVAGRITLTADEKAIDSRYLGFTIGPHEECAVEEAVRIIEASEGESVALTLGPPEAIEQLRDAMAMGVSRAIHLVTDGADWDAEATAAAILEAIREDEAASGPFDLILMGNEAADAGGYQVAVRVGSALQRPVADRPEGRDRLGWNPSWRAGRQWWPGCVQRPHAGCGDGPRGSQPAALPVRPRTTPREVQARGVHDPGSTHGATRGDPARRAAQRVEGGHHAR